MDRDTIVFIIVVGLRLLVPLLIFRFPFPGIMACLIIDAYDQTAFQTLTDINLDDPSASGYLDYEPYDKALDIFYLVMAYLSIFRNWRNPAAITVAIFLWYWRLFGATLFELVGWRPLLLIFPNAFEFFFIYVCLAKLAWDTTKIGKQHWWKAAAAIWVFIKLPQEYWLHVAQLDFTVEVKTQLLGVDADSAWGDALSNRPLVSAAMAIGVAIFVLVMVRVWKSLPRHDFPVTIDSNKVQPMRHHGDPGVWRWTDGILEKIALSGMISIIFVEAIGDSGTRTSSIHETLLAVVVLIAGNALVTQWMGGRGRTWASTLGAFAGTLLLNGLLLLILTWLPVGEDFDVEGAAFFLVLLSLIVSLFDRYHPHRQDLGGQFGMAGVPAMA